MNQRRQDILRAYHQMVLAQVPEAHIRLAFEEGDLENLQEDIMKAYWKYVREFFSFFHTSRKRVRNARIASESVLPAALSPTVIR